MKKIRMSILGMVLLLSMGLCGCSLFGRKMSPMLRIDDKEYSRETVALVVEAEADVLQQLYGEACWDTQINGSDFAEIMRPMVQDDVMHCFVFAYMAESEGLTLTEEEQAQADRIASRLLSSHFKKASDGDEELVHSMVNAYVLSRKYQNNVRSVAGSSVSEDAATVIRGRQLVIHFSNEEERAAAKNKINQVMDLLDSGKTFNQVVSLYSDSNDIMVEFRKNEVTEEWQKSLFSVPAGQISNLIERDDCYMIYQSIDDKSDDMTEDNRNGMIYDSENTLLQNAYDKFSGSHQIWWDYETWNKMDLKEYVTAEADLFAVYRDVTAS